MKYSHLKLILSRIVEEAVKIKNLISHRMKKIMDLVIKNKISKSI
jgi:hypothetical protein